MSELTVEEIEELLYTFRADDDESWERWSDEWTIEGMAADQQWEAEGNEPQPPYGPYINVDGKVVVHNSYGGYGTKAVYRDATPEELEKKKKYEAWHNRRKKWMEDKSFSGVAVPGVGTVFLEKHHGGEGQGEEYWFVLRVETVDGTTRYFRMNGWYASFDGGYYDGPFEEVSPVQKVVTFYE